MPLSFFSQPRFSPLAFPGWPEPSALASSTPRIHSAISLHKTWHRWNSVLESRDDGAGGPKPPCQRNRHLPNCPIAPGSGNAGRAGDQGSRTRCERWLDDKPVEWAQLIALRAALKVFPLVLEGFERGRRCQSGREFTDRRLRCGGVWLSRRLPVKTQPARRETHQQNLCHRRRRRLRCRRNRIPVAVAVLRQLAAPDAAAATAAAYAATTTTLDTIDAATRAATYAAARADPYSSVADNVWATVSADAQWLETNKEGLEGQPLMARGCAQRRRTTVPTSRPGPANLSTPSPKANWRGQAPGVWSPTGTGRCWWVHVNARADEACLTRRSKFRSPRSRMTSGAGKTRRR
jgi:hypothetical protein